MSTLAREPVARRCAQSAGRVCEHEVVRLRGAPSELWHVVVVMVVMVVVMVVVSCGDGGVEAVRSCTS